MKIGIISNLYPPFMRGGAEIIASIEAEGLKKAWQHVFVISSKPAKVQTGPNAKPITKLIIESEVNEVLVYRFTPVNLYYYMNDFRFPAFIRALWHVIDTFNIFSYFTVRKILKKEKPDLIITHNLMGVGFLIPMLLRRLKIKHIHTIHDVQLVTPSGLIIKDKEGALSHKLARWFGYTSIMRYLIGSPAVVVSPSKFLLDFYKQSNFFPKSKKIVLPNPTKGMVEIIKQPSPNLEILYLGQIHKAKGILDLIDNFKKLKQKQLVLHVVGVGPDLAKARELAKDDKRIKFYGWMHHSRLLPLIGRMDVLVVPSLCYENSPTVIYEALNMGLPILAADIGGVAELIKEGINGWIFPAGDFATLNKKIEGLYQQREKLKLMAAQCQRSVEPFYIDNYVSQILELAND